MYDSIWNAVRPRLSAERMRADIAEFFAFSRWSSFDKINELAELIAKKMTAAGMEDVRLIPFPADGKTAYGGWIMPLAYDAREARLTLLGADGSVATLADYQVNPVSLMLYSQPTPPEGVTAELALADTLGDMTPERLAGRLALTSGIGIEYSRAAMRAGALGLISDCRNGHRFFKNGLEVDAANEWHNYTLPPWDVPNKGFGFSLSPEQGRRLRGLLAAGQTVRLHALVDTRHYEGVLPVVSGLLPGTEGAEPEEIVLTGHYDEYGADDNCSQIAVAVEVCRALRALIQSGEISPLRRSLRVLLPMEARGFNALIQNDAEVRRIRAGLNIDTVGTDQNAATAVCTLSDNLMALPSYAEEFTAELLGRVAEQNPLFRWRRMDAEMIDNIFGEPLIGAPTPSLWHFSATHHLATDAPERISGPMLLDMAQVAATYAAFLANAGLPEALWLAELTASQAERRFQEIIAAGFRGGDAKQKAGRRRRLSSLQEQYAQKLDTPGRLVPDPFLFPCPALLGEREQHLIGAERLLPQEVFQQRVAPLKAQIKRSYAEALARMEGQESEFFGVDVSEAAADEEPAPASRCVPVKTFRGFAAFEDLNDEDTQYVQNTLEIPFGYGAPMWLQNALMFANGKRTAGDIAALLSRHAGMEIEAGRLERLFDFLARRGMIRLRPYLTQEDVRAALVQAGIEKGDLVLGHFALSRFGYIEGGANGLIETLLTLLGPDGTLAMPTFTFSWLGRLPYDSAVTASRVGAVTDCFWRRPGVLRSAHPTHSFAAVGPLASALLAGHDYRQSPLSEGSPLARLEERDGKVLLFARRASNTTMHLGEYRAGLPLLDFLCPIVENGIRREALVPNCPWHNCFEAAYAKLDARGQARDVPLGESVLTVMRCRDAITAQAGVLRETPEALLSSGCDCLYCQRLRQHCSANAEKVTR